MINAYQHMTGATEIRDPEEQKIAERFNAEFAEVYRVIPDENKQNFVNMLHLIYEMIWLESLRGFAAGQKLN